MLKEAIYYGAFRYFQYFRIIKPKTISQTRVQSMLSPLSASPARQRIIRIKLLAQTSAMPSF